MKLQENYFIIQDSISQMMLNYKNPVIWNTQRQSGKTTVLIGLIIKQLRTSGDYWLAAPNLQTEELIIQKVYRELKKDDKIVVRKSRSRIEVLSENHTARLLSTRKFSTILEGIKYPQPNGIFIDEVNIVGIAGIQQITSYLSVGYEKEEINLYGVTTSIGSDVVDLISKKFHAPEVITTNFLSKEMKYINMGLSELEANAQITEK